MNKYLKVFWRSVCLSTGKFIAYRTHFLISLMTALVYGLINLTFFWLVFNAGGVNEIAGFTVHEVYFVFGVTQVIYALMLMFFYESANAFRYHVHGGWLDMLIVRPISTVFYSTFERVYYFTSFSIIIYSSLIFYYSVPQLDVVWSLVNILKLLFIILVGLLVFASLVWISSLAWLFWPNFRSLRMLITNSFNFNQNPPMVYPNPMRWALTVILPVLVIGNQTYYWLRGEYGWQMMLRDLGILTIFLLIYTVFWRGGLKRYNSAN